MAGRGESGLREGDWAEEEEQDNFGTNVEVVDADVDSQISTAAPKQTGNIWGALPSAPKTEKPAKSEPYRPGAQQMKKKVDGYFPELGAAPAEPPKEQQPKDTSNRFSELQEKEPPAPAKPAPAAGEGRGSRKKNKEWKTVDLNAKVATTVAEQDIVLQAEANKMYEPKVVKSYAQRPERRSDFTGSGETDTIWRKTGDAVSVPEPRPAPTFSARRDEPFRRAEDAPRRDEPIRRNDEPIRRSEEPIRRSEEPIRRSEEPIRRSEEPIRRIEDSAPLVRAEAVKTEPIAWRSSLPPAPVETERKEGPPRKFVNTKKKTDASEEPREDEWKAADKQAQERPKVNMWAMGDPRI